MTSQLITKRDKRKLIKAVLGLMILVIGSLWQYYSSQPGSPKPVAPPGYYLVTQFVDGDTIQVDMAGTSETIRFIGVDTPETHDPRKVVQCFGANAAEYTKKRIGSQPVRLEADPLNTNRDRYNRLLRYVYLPDGTLVNAEIIKNGYGFAYTSFPFGKIEEFKTLQKKAQENLRGLWSSCSPSTNEYGGYTSSDAI